MKGGEFLNPLSSAARLQFNRLRCAFRLNVVAPEVGEPKVVEASATDRAAGVRSSALISSHFLASVSGPAASLPVHRVCFLTRVNPVFPKPPIQGSNGFGEGKRGDPNVFHPGAAATNWPDPLLEVPCHAD